MMQVFRSCFSFRCLTYLRGLTPVLVLLAGLAASAPPAVAQTAVTGSDLLTQAAATVGVAPGSLTSATVTGTLTEFRPDGDRTTSFTLKTTGPNRVRWDLQQANGTLTRVVRDGGGWVKRGTRSANLSLRMLSGHTVELMPVFALSQWLGSARVTIERKGIVEIDGRSLIRLDVTRSHPGSPPEDFQTAFRRANRCEVYLDAGTGQLVRLRYFRHPGDWRRDVPVDVVPSNYQTVQGVAVPMTVTQFIWGRKASEYTIGSVSFNDAIADAEFARN